MPSAVLVAQDRPFIVDLASSFTIYQTYKLAKAAAVTLSANNASAPAYTAKVYAQVTAATPPLTGRVDVYPGSPGAWIIQLASGTTYLPRATAVATAFTTSASNSNAAVLVARTFESCVGP